MNQKESRYTRWLLIALTVSVGMLGLGTSASANPQSYGQKKAHGGYGHAGTHHGSHGARHHGGHHQGAGTFFEHLLKFKDGLGLTKEQEAQIQQIKTTFQKSQIRLKADVDLANIDLHELLRDDQADLGRIEVTMKEIHERKAELYVASIKARREAKAVLTTEQNERMRKVHERIKAHSSKMKGSQPHGYGLHKSKSMPGHHGASYQRTPGNAKEAQGKQNEQEVEENEKVSWAEGAKISAQEAITVAIKKVPGKPIEAELEEKDDVLVWEVEVATAEGEVVKLFVDPSTGAVVGGS